jgi:methionine-rich copper-binding protein CopC
MSRGFRLVSMAGCVLVLVVATTAVAFAHARYDSSTPGSSATVATAPTAVSVTFTEELASIQIAITGPHGTEVTTDNATIDLAHRTNASVPIKNDGPGVYTVVWKNVSGDDGDPNDGAFVFTVAGTPPAPAAAPAAPAANAPAAPAANAPVAAAAPVCVDNGLLTPGISDVRVNTYCKRQTIRDKYRGQIDENTFNLELADGVGLDHALADAMDAMKGH